MKRVRDKVPGVHVIPNIINIVKKLTWLYSWIHVLGECGEMNGQLRADARVSQGGGGPCSPVPFKNWLVFHCSHSFFALVPYRSQSARPPPPNPLLLDSGLYVAALKSLMLTDRYFLFCYLQLISNSKYFSYPWNQLTKLLVAFSTDSNFKWPTNCYFIQILLPIKRNRRSNTTISWGASTFVMMGAGPKVH